MKVTTNNKGNKYGGQKRIIQIFDKVSMNLTDRIIINETIQEFIEKAKKDERDEIIREISEIINTPTSNAVIISDIETKIQELNELTVESSELFNSKDIIF